MSVWHKKPEPVSDADILRMLDMQSEGMKPIEIANAFGRSRGVVGRILRECNATDDPAPTEQRGAA